VGRAATQATGQPPDRAGPGATERPVLGAARTRAASGSRGDAGTKARILDIAERLVQVCGFNGFSYGDVAAELGITRAALHYHFASKGELGEALIDRYTTRFGGALAALDSDTSSAPELLRGYAGIYLDVLRQERMCLCGMLAAEYQTLSPPMRAAVVRFLDHNETWLAGVLERGAAAGSVQVTGSAQDTARMIVGGLEGAMLVARPYGDVARFEAAADNLLAGLTSPAAPAG
jgi:TetR/AcrR family transcriptional regulator, transcriptional repressor for nem operon